MKKAGLVAAMLLTFAWVRPSNARPEADAIDARETTPANAEINRMFKPILMLLSTHRLPSHMAQHAPPFGKRVEAAQH